MAANIVQTGTLTATITGSARLKGELGIPTSIGAKQYQGGNGIVVNDTVISLDSLIIDCGRGTTTA